MTNNSENLIKKCNTLLHVCCAPCSGSIIESLLDKVVPITVFFYNPNIYPREEYDRRKKCLKEFALKKGLKYYDGDYDTANWEKAIRGYENAKEGGVRCQRCWYLRLVRAAHFAHSHNFNVFTSTLGISRWKPFDQICYFGEQAAKLYPNLEYLSYNWRKKGGSEQMHKIAKREGFYQQNYCGCKASLK